MEKLKFIVPAVGNQGRVAKISFCLPPAPSKCYVPTTRGGGALHEIAFVTTLSRQTVEPLQSFLLPFVAASCIAVYYNVKLTDSNGHCKHGY